MPLPPARPLLRRPTGPVAGVSRGLAEHLGIDVRVMRGAFLLLALAQGAGFVAYALFWWLMPVDASAPLTGRRRFWPAVFVVLLVATVGVVLGNSLVWPLAVAAAGVVTVWWQADESQRARWFATATAQDQRMGRLRVAAGALLVAIGAAAVIGTGTGIGETGRALAAGAVLVGGLALVTAPYWLRMARDLSAERAARVREQERAEVAAHVHDSVLHTLTLIQRHIDDPRQVARLARAQERELRTWLYRPGADASGAFVVELERVVAEVEDAHGVPVELVTVGDARLDDGLNALLRATREAAVNAAKHGHGAPVSVFAEVGGGRAEVFVRDRGPGFSLEGVPSDRMGVRQSILGRMERHGGRAEIRSGPQSGTEVALEMPVMGEGERT